MKNSGRVGGLHREKVLARSALGFLAAFLLVTLTFSGAPMGAFAGPLQASGSPSPSGSGGPVTTAVKFLNPSPAYNPHLFPEEGEGVIVEDPKISDKFDGTDNAYHIVVGITNPPDNLVAEASIRYEGENDVTIGELSPVLGRPNAYELFWDIPDGLPSGSATMFVRLFSQTATGFQEVANDSVAVDVQHVNDPPSEAEETAALTWPTQNGEIGFYKPRGGTWRATVEGFTSAQALRYQLFYSTTPLGQAPKYTFCTGQSTPGAASQSRKAFTTQCTLAGQDVPTAITAMGVVAEDIDLLHQGRIETLSMDSADVHVVRPYVQAPEQMTISLIPIPSPVDNNNLESAGRARTIADRCLSYLAEVKDHLGRPVTGANIDVHAEGPDDQLRFGDDDVSAARAPGTYKVPDKGGHSTENGANCSNQPNGQALGSQGDHNVPGGDDIKHRESLGGTGVSGSAGVGQWEFYLYSQTPGFTNLTAWVDDESITDVKEQRPVDSDTLDPGEPVATARAQWYSDAPTLEFVPLGDTAAAGTCNEFLLKARAGTAAIPGVNVDLHAQGPDDGLDFCDVAGGTPRRAPDEGEHDGEDGGESTEQEPSPKSQHTEGETNDEGNMVVGVVSPTTGDTNLTAWIDGEVGFDDDEQGAAADEPVAAATMSWANSSGDATVTFLNPSPYGGANTISKKTDADATYHIVVRVDAPSLVPGVELQIGSGTGEDFEKSKDLGTATNIAGTDTYQLAWPVDVADDDYTLRAQIAGTSVVADQEVTVNAVSSMQPGDVPAETIELTRPLLAQQTAFERQTTPVEGIASAGTEGVDIFYTKAAANQTLAEANWINCGFLQLSGEGSTPQPFKATCRLTGADQAVQVTGIAAAPFDCMEPLPGAGCDASADAVPELGRNPGGLESGDAHRIFGYEARPVISLTPPENESSFDDCTKLVLQVTDQTGQVLTGQNVDAHLTGPSDSAHFCNPDDGSATPRRAPDQGGHSAVAGHDDQGAHVADQADTQHTEGETTAQGRFVFGLRGNEGGDSQILVWVDQTDNDVQDTGEPSDSSVMHWIERRTDACTEIGTPGADVLTGTTDADKLCGKGGNDRLLGKGGNDILLGGKGNDRIGGGSGDDNINASRGKDRLSGAKGNDRLKGAAGRDRLNGGAGTDSCQGGPGRDRVRKCEGGGAASARLVRGGVA